MAAALLAPPPSPAVEAFRAGRVAEALAGFAREHAELAPQLLTAGRGEPDTLATALRAATAASNAALAALRLARPRAALRWSEAALVALGAAGGGGGALPLLRRKTHLRLAQALLALGRTADALAAADTRAGAEETAVAEAARRGLREAKGDFDWHTLRKRGSVADTSAKAGACVGTGAAVADFVSDATRVGRSPGRGLGVFAARDIAPGTLLAVCRPIAAVVLPVAAAPALGGKTDAGSACGVRGSLVASVDCERLATEVMARLAADAADDAVPVGTPTLRDEVLALCRLGEMAHFGEDVAPASDGEVVDSVITANAYASEGTFGLFRLASRFNHGCAASCAWALVSGLHVVVCTDGAAEGEELLLAYLRPNTEAEAAAAQSSSGSEGCDCKGGGSELARDVLFESGWHFRCACGLCRGERALNAVDSGSAARRSLRWLHGPGPSSGHECGDGDGGKVGCESARELGEAVMRSLAELSTAGASGNDVALAVRFRAIAPLTAAARAAEETVMAAGPSPEAARALSLWAALHACCSGRGLAATQAAASAEAALHCAQLAALTGDGAGAHSWIERARTSDAGAGPGADFARFAPHYRVLSC
jgi:hypothetical protein